MSTRPARRLCCASAMTPIATTAPAVRARRAATVPTALPAVPAMTPRLEPTDVDRPSPPVLPSPQILPVLRPRRAEDRPQGHAVAVALHLRTRQDRALAHHRRLGRQ